MVIIRRCSNCSDAVVIAQTLDYQTPRLCVYAGNPEACNALNELFLVVHCRRCSNQTLCVYAGNPEACNALNELFLVVHCRRCSNQTLCVYAGNPEACNALNELYIEIGERDKIMETMQVCAHI